MSETLASVPHAPPPFQGTVEKKRGFQLPGTRMSRTELLAVLLAFVMAGGSLGIFMSGISIWRILLGVDDDAGGELVGRLEREDGMVRRQRDRSTEFLPLESGAQLFNHDFIVTGSDASASIALEDGGVIELGPSTLIRLAFDSSFTLGGVVRGTRVELVEGEVSGQAGNGQLRVKSRDGVTRLSGSARSRVRAAAAPIVIPKIAVPSAVVPPIASSLPPPPVVNELQLVRSSLGRAMEIVPVLEQRRVVARASVRFETFGVVPEEVRSKPPVLEVVANPETPDSPARIYSLSWAQDGSLGGEVVLPQAGRYEWKLRPASDSRYELKAVGEGVALEGGMTARSELVGIQVLSPRIGGRELKDNQFVAGQVLKSGGERIEIRWKLIQPIRPGSFEVSVSDAAASAGADGRAPGRLATASAAGNSATLQSSGLLGRPVRIEVRSRLESGFVLVSEPYPFEFRLLPPALSTPKANAQLSLKTVSERADGAILLTWKRTHLTDEYRIQIATDASFRRLVLEESVEENFFVWTSPKVGTYWWRVRGRVAGKPSDYSTPNALVLNP